MTAIINRSRPKIKKTLISTHEYNQKRYEIAKDILTNVLTSNEVQSGESKQRDSLIFNSIAIANQLLEELYTVSATPTGDEPSIHIMSELMKKSKG